MNTLFDRLSKAFSSLSLSLIKQPRKNLELPIDSVECNYDDNYYGDQQCR